MKRIVNQNLFYFWSYCLFYWQFLERFPNTNNIYPISDLTLDENYSSYYES